MNTQEILIHVVNGEIENEAGQKAMTCAGDILKDGWYFMFGVHDDPPHARPYKTKQEAYEAAKEWLGDYLEETYHVDP